MDVDSTCPVPTEAYFLKQTKVPYRRVELYSNTKLHGANSDIDKSLKREKSDGILLKEKSGDKISDYLTIIDHLSFC